MQRKNSVDIYKEFESRKKHHELIKEHWSSVELDMALGFIDQEKLLSVMNAIQIHDQLCLQLANKYPEIPFRELVGL